ncbi:MAG: twin-arginine translocase TatA/TatE family subunit [Chloroflexota bacterium]
MPFRLGPMEITLILLVVMILFGVGRLPEVGAGLGKGIKEFRNGISGKDSEAEVESEDGKS